VVELTDDPVPPITQPAPTTSLPEPPPLAPPIALPSMPPTIAVAAPSPSIAFAVPVQAPAKIVEPAQASYRATILTQRVESAPAPAPQPLTYGVGEGRQPAPEYPRLAMRLGQEGVVVVRLSVGADGRVVAAEASSPSPWPLLNEAALRVVRQRWRFSSGVARAYEVAIRFQLNRTNS
jgi:protein TonB